MDHLRSDPPINNQFRYISVSFACSIIPVAVIAFLPDPWHTSLLPIATLLGAYAFFFASGLVLIGLEQLWRLFRPRSIQPLRCPACYTVDQAYRPFYATRVAPHVLRVHCPECHESWIERR